MVTREEVLKQMKEKLENDMVTQGVLLDYKTFQFESDPKYKGNTEAKKELDTVKFGIERTEAMLKWINEQLA